MAEAPPPKKARSLQSRLNEIDGLIKLRKIHFAAACETANAEEKT